ncbi:MAG: hypothetical protein KA801_12460 [Syntrophorhabdaceae bacterium]|nr:hypothetical protein [Syntrophorhabdaceae bacterium]
MSKVILSLLLFFLLVLFPNYDHAGSIKQEYELQERCGKRAAEVFKEHYGEGFEKGSLSNYTCHYNRKLNRCFMLLTTIIYSKIEKGEMDLGVFTDKGLWDINENKAFGHYSAFSKAPKTMDCNVLEKGCHSENDWNVLVKPFMEE